MIVQPGHHQNRNLRPAGPAAQLGAGGETVHLRHHHVHQHDIGMDLFEFFHAPAAVFGLFDLKARLFQRHAHQQPNG